MLLASSFPPLVPAPREHTPSPSRAVGLVLFVRVLYGMVCSLRPLFFAGQPGRKTVEDSARPPAALTPTLPLTRPLCAEQDNAGQSSLEARGAAADVLRLRARDGHHRETAQVVGAFLCVCVFFVLCCWVPGLFGEASKESRGTVCVEHGLQASCRENETGSEKTVVIDAFGVQFGQG